MRILHTMLRVGDLQRSIDFYTRVLGMKLLRRARTASTSTPWPLSVTVTRRMKR